MPRLDGKVAVITGAASGMGRAAAELFTTEGAAVVVGDVNEEQGEAVAAGCRERGARCVFQRTDVAIEGDIQAAVARAADEFGGLHIMINNAGIGGPIGLDTSIDDWDRAHAVILRAAWLGMKHAVPLMRSAGGGAIVSTASDNGIRSLPHTHAYTSLKAGVIKLTESVAQVVGPDRIRVNVIAPGWIRTPMLEAGLSGSEEFRQQMLSGAQPLPMVGSPLHIARAMLFLCSDDAEFITGVCLPVDGGWLTQGYQNPGTEKAFQEIARGAGDSASQATSADWLADRASD